MANEADAILARFPGPVTLKPSRRKWLLLLLTAAAFTAAGVDMVVTAQPHGWAVLIFFGAGTIVSVVMLLPGAGGLTLDRDGFTIISLFRANRSRWQNVTGFQAISVPFSSKAMVGFDDVTAKGNALAAVSTAMAGRGAALPDTYGLAVEELVRLMTQWRERAVSG
jgi:hypothetical protein